MVDWNFPSPTATPTAAQFGQNVFQTPKTTTFPSHFTDAFSTPQMPGYTPQQADYATMTPIQRQQQTTSSDTLRSNYYANMQAGVSVAVGGHGMLPPPPSHTGYQGHMLSPTYAHYSHAQPVTHSGAPVSFDTSQMQTPPPTRGTSVKKAAPGQHVAFGTPSTIASRRFMTPQQALATQQPSQGQTHTPMQYPHMNFSPSVYQFGNFGPASAPVFPQTQLLWEPSANQEMYGNQQPMLDDPFAPAATQSMSMGWSGAQIPHSNAQAVSFDTPAMGSFPVQPPMQRSASAAPFSSSQPPHLSPPVMGTASVDPSLVYSSPIRPVLPAEATPISSRPVKGRVTGPRNEAKRKDSATVNHERVDTVSPTDSTSNSISKPLRRSNTTGTARPRNAHPSTDTESMLRPPRTASPMKRLSKLPLGSISETKKPNKPRTSVVLTVDESGRARTETKVVDDPSKLSIRERYPGLFDSDSSDEETEEEDQTPSRSASFSLAKGEQRRTKAARLDPPLENLDGLTLPRSSSSASMKVTPSRAAIAATAQLRRTGSLRKQTPSRSGSRRTAPNVTTSIDTAPMDTHADRRQSLVGSQHSPLQDHDWMGSTLDAHNRRWSMMSLEQSQSGSPTHQFPDNPYAPPNSRHMAQQARLIRCSCGVASDRGQAMVQCGSCYQFSHLLCAGLPTTAHAAGFTCFLCTKPNTGLQIARPDYGQRS